VEKAVRNLHEPGSQNTESRGRLAARLAAEREPPGNPDARGTSRTLGVDPTQHPRLGSMQYHDDAADAWVEGPSVRPFRSPGEVGDEHRVLQPRFRRRASLLVRPQYRRPRKPQHVTSLLRVHFLKGHVPSAEQPALGKRSRKIALGQIAERARPRVQPAPAPDEALRG
jgi:hypothetical protein